MRALLSLFIAALLFTSACSRTNEGQDSPGAPANQPADATQTTPPADEAPGSTSPDATPPPDQTTPPTTAEDPSATDQTTTPPPQQ